MVWCLQGFSCLQDEEEPKDDTFSPDGGYIPRILFMDPSGRVHPEIINERGNPSYKYFYTNAEQEINDETFLFLFLFCHVNCTEQAFVILHITVIQGMKKAQEELTGDAFKKKHLGDEL
ncbi:hypothetical protein lerEdw1_011690 [Lerista edwardsae]|nr:hypothetical protein lerEdw1_011690 [Lerista edwardsae]